jgi:hypothetical protein
VTLEIYSIKPGPDGLTRVTLGRRAPLVGRAAEHAEDAVLDEWAESPARADRVLGYPPSW